MRYCPSCKGSYPAGTALCATDRTELVDELPFQTIESEAGTWVEIASTSTEDEARLLQGFLEAEGIDCQVESLKFTMEPVNLGSMGEIRVYVSADKEAEAMRLIHEREVEYERMGHDDSLLTDEGPATIDAEEEVDPELRDR